MRALVVYYSWTGNTAKAAKSIALALGADLEEISEVHPRKGRFAQLRCALDSMFRLKPRIAASCRNLAAYDVVVVGSPVWARAMAGPVRSWLMRERGKLAAFAGFCTEAGAGGETVIDVMGQAASRPPLARLVLRQSELDDESLQLRTTEFARAISAALGTRDLAATAA